MNQKRIAETTSEFYGVNLAEMKSLDRHQRVAWPRNVCMYLASNLKFRKSDIGRFWNRARTDDSLQRCKEGGGRDRGGQAKAGRGARDRSHTKKEMTKVFITGITGQDGSYLAEKLLARGYEVHGLVRRASSFNTARIDHIFDRVQLHRGDMTDYLSLRAALKSVKPDQIYNLAAMSQVRDSFAVMRHTTATNFIGAADLMAAAWDICPNAKLYQASTSEMYGNTGEFDSDGNLKPITEDAPLRPVSPYGIAKTAAHHEAQRYRHLGLRVSCGILFNHESERRGNTFVTQKIAKAAAEFAINKREDSLKLGNLDAARDWGYAPDYMDAAILINEYKHDDDYVIATGQTWTVEDFLTKAFQYVGLGDYEEFVEIAQRLKRPNELWALRGDYSKAKADLGWSPAVEFQELVQRMVDHQIDRIFPK